LKVLEAFNPPERVIDHLLRGACWLHWNRTKSLIVKEGRSKEKKTQGEQAHANGDKEAEKGRKERGGRPINRRFV
jgi:hypothetical protein